MCVRYANPRLVRSNHLEIGIHHITPASDMENCSIFLSLSFATWRKNYFLLRSLEEQREIKFVKLLAFSRDSLNIPLS